MPGNGILLELWMGFWGSRCEGLGNRELHLTLARQPQDTRDSLRVHDLAAHHHTHRALERDEVHLDVLVFFGSRFALRELLREEQVHALVEKSRRRPEAERMRPLLRRDAGLFR